MTYFLQGALIALVAFSIFMIGVAIGNIKTAELPPCFVVTSVSLDRDGIKVNCDGYNFKTDSLYQVGDTLFVR